MTTLDASNPGGDSPSGQEGLPRDRGGSVPGVSFGSVMIAGGILLIVFVGLFFRWFQFQHRWSSRHMEDWGHAYLIPVIAGYLIWQNREKIASTRIAAFWPGLLPILTGIMCYFFFVVGTPNHMLQGFSLILTLFGIVLMLLGPAMMRWLFLPIAFLVFGVTISEMIMIQITFPLRMLAADGGYVALKMIGAVFGFTADVNGSILTVLSGSGESHPLDVAEACSGMRMVIAYLALSAAVAVLGCREWWQRVALMLLAAPVAVFMNIIRVATLGIFSLIDPELASGDAHTLIGTILLIPGLGLFLLVVWALNKALYEPSDQTNAVTAPVASSLSCAQRFPNKKAISCAFAMALIVLGGSAAGMSAAIQSYGLHLQKKPIYPEGGRTLLSLPRRTVSWFQIGQDEVVSAEVLDVLGTDNYVTRQYARASIENPDRPDVVNLHAAYYTGMIDTVPHVPDRCLVGAGWQIAQNLGAIPLPLDGSRWIELTEVPENLAGQAFTTRLPNDPQYTDSPGLRVTLPLNPHALSIRVTEFLSPDGQRLFAGYFFVANGGAVSSANGVRLLAFNLTTDYAYYLKIQISSTNAQSAEDLAAMAADLLDELLGELMRSVPDWVKVERGLWPPSEN